MNIGLALLISLLLVAAVSDMRYGKIPNLLVLLGTIAATLFHTLAEPGYGVLPDFLPGSIDLLSMLSGILVGFVCLFPLYALRAMGAGDVKLMMMIGAFLGPLPTFGVVVLTFIAGGVLAVAMTLWKRSFRQLASNVRFILTTSAINTVAGSGPRFEPLQHTVGRMPYAVAIAAGTLMQFVLVRNGGWALA